MARTRNIDFSPENWPRLLFRFFNSFGLAATVLFFLTIVTLLGTLNQTEESLFDSQKKYFESFWIVDKVGNWPVFLPGGALLIGILFVNILLGTIVKIRKNWKNIGLYVSHIGILILIVSAFVTKQFAWEGNMALYPGMKSNVALSYHDWQLEILPVNEDGEASEALVIPYDQIRDIRDESRAFRSERLPFDLEVERYYRNAVPVPASAPIAKQGGKAIDGYVLVEQPPAKEAEANTAGLYARILPEEDTGEPREAIIYAHLGGNFQKRIPYSVEVDGKQYAIQLVRERMQIPFTLKLDEFIFEKYGGSATAKNYQSNVTKIEDGTTEQIEIKMNEPLRHGGYTFFQASFGPSNAGPDEELYTQFAVVKNPSDHWPLASLIVVFAGLLFHLILKLSEHLNRTSGSGRKAVPA